MSQKLALILGVGAERGLGAALCRKAAAEGHHVIAAGRTLCVGGRLPVVWVYQAASAGNSEIRTATE